MGEFLQVASAMATILGCGLQYKEYISNLRTLSDEDQLSRGGKKGEEIYGDKSGALSL